MKITIEIDCTPVEARQFVGLPDVQPMQERLMVEIEEQMRKAALSMSPEAVLQRWMNLMPAGIEPMKNAFEQMLKGRSGI